MPLDGKLSKRLASALQTVDEHSTEGARLIDDARRLWRRVQRLVRLDLVADPDVRSLEVACWAMQLPMRQAKLPSAGKLGKTNLRDRAEQAAELLISTLSDDADDELLDRVARLLHETPHRPPMLEDARLLADAVNLEDFGIIGLVGQMIQLARQGDGIVQLVEGCDKREQYGYWEARLKDGFHFEPVRQIAKRRLARARQVAQMLADELKEDSGE
ncbi:MAG TPA: hypothetical protein VHD56_15985 [Tepidisphaeraceae bacterium]|nr:hypothetical protein [Tepidisphaeraceae bacterium]